jgi:hypothetical protein
MSELSGSLPSLDTRKEERAQIPEDEKLKMGGSEVESLTDDQKRRLGLLSNKETSDEEPKSQPARYTYAP